MRPTALLLFLWLVLSGCCKPSPADTDSPARIRFSGVVTRVPIEGGFYGIIAADGRRYDPVNLAQEFRRDGLPVEVVGRLPAGVVGFHQWGTAIEIIEIRRR